MSEQSDKFLLVQMDMEELIGICSIRMGKDMIMFILGEELDQVDVDKLRTRKMSKAVTLIFTPLVFYANIDEDCCFKWIDDIKCIEKYEGVGRELHIKVSSNAISIDEVFFEYIKKIEKYRYRRKF